MAIVELERFLREVAIERQTLEQWIELRWITPVHGGVRPTLSDTDAARAMFIRELTRDFGVNDEGVGIVLHLVDQLHGLRRAMDELRGELDARAQDT